ncbi:hypothetical protein [Hyphococcus sp.]|uniref:hypothetical protein n=1 Tax=Hyphococcus sp. TaxID=2038636 RepID=UPI003D120F70
MQKTAALLAAAGALVLSGCGFQPIYATRDGLSSVNSQIYLKQVVAPETVAPYLEDALNARIVSVDGVAPRYELVVQANETAERLAVQIDATVTRYNYRLAARYWVVDTETRQNMRGVARAVTSYNIVNSQYSTLFAERTAVEKAARELAEEIERDILIRFSQPPEKRESVDPETFEDVLEPDETPLDRRRRSDRDNTTLPEELQYLNTDSVLETPDSDSSVELESDAGAADDTVGGAATPDVPDPIVDDRP